MQGYNGPRTEQGCCHCMESRLLKSKKTNWGFLITASYHVKIPPRHNAVFEVNIHVETEGMQVIKGNKHLLEKHPNMYQHEIAMVPEEKFQEISFIGNHKPGSSKNFAFG